MADDKITHNAHNFQDLTGQRFGLLAVIRRDPRTKRKVAFWHCRCDCGNEKTLEAFSLTSSARTDCGCRRGEKWKAAAKLYHDAHPQPTAMAIVLTNGYAVIVDEDYYCLVSQYWWSPHEGAKTYYARASVGDERVLMHVLIMGTKDGFEIDHINGNGLDNRRCNLRWVTKSQQSRNIHGGRGRSLFKGVSWSSRHRKWVATISVDGKNRAVGYFDEENDAATAYDKAAKEHYGEFAWLNFNREVASE